MVSSHYDEEPMLKTNGARQIAISGTQGDVPNPASENQAPFFEVTQGGFNLNADVLQAHNAGIARLLPYTGCTVKLCDVYSLRSAYASSHGVAYWSAIFQKEEIVDWETAKKCCEEYRRVRRFFPCDFHNHRSATMDPTSWAIWQFHDPEKNEGVVMAFRRSLSPFPVARVPLKGLPEGAMGGTENLDTDVKKVLQGELEISLSKPRSSSVILYHVV